MLRTLIVKNFVKYEETQRLKFDNGVNFVVGGNATGKTALFELIRRCLSTSSNSEISNIPKEENPSFAVCKFQINEDLSETLKRDGLTYKNGTHLYSCHFVKSDNDRKDRKLIYRLTYIPECERDTEICSRGKINLDVHVGVYNVERLCYEYRGDHFYCWCGDDDSADGQLFKEKLQALDDNDCDIDVILSNIIEKADVLQATTAAPAVGNHPSPRTNTLAATHQKIIFSNYASYASVCEQILRKLENVVAMTFPLRGNGPHQWNKSMPIHTDVGRRDNDVASERAEILQQLLGSEDVDQVKAHRIFTTLVYPLKYTFEKMPRTGSSGTQTDQFNIVIDGGTSIMKIPEGILEAYRFSLLLAHKTFQTICLEEPDRGMHPPMVQKMRDLLLRKEKSKTLLIITHRQSMIGFWAYDRVFMCRGKRKAKDGRRVHYIRKLTGDPKPDNSKPDVPPPANIELVYQSTDGTKTDESKTEDPKSDNPKSADPKPEYPNTDDDPMQYDQEMVKRSQEHQIKQMMFASSVLFVEGVTDRVVLGAVFDQIMECDTVTKGLFSPEEIQKLQLVIAEIYMIEVGGNTPFNNYKDLADKVGVPYRFLFDKDAVFITTTKTKLMKLEKETKRMGHVSKKRRTEQANPEMAVIAAKAARIIILKAVRASVFGQNTEHITEFLQMETDTPGEPVYKYIGRKPHTSCQPLTSVEIRTVLRDMYFPTPELTAKTNKSEKVVINVEGDNKDDMESYTKRRIFIWRDGNLEDVILKSITDLTKDAEMKALLKIVLHKVVKDKDHVKEAIKVMGMDTARQLAQHLLDTSVELEKFLKFLLDSGSKEMETFMKSLLGSGSKDKDTS